MSNLRSQVVKLAFDNPGEIRDKLLPILKKESRQKKALSGYAVVGPIKKAISRVGGQLHDALMKTGIVDRVLIDWEMQDNDLICLFWFQAPSINQQEAEGLLKDMLGIHAKVTQSGSAWKARIEFNVLP